MSARGIGQFDGTRLREAREAAGLTQEAVAERIAAMRPDSPAGTGQTSNPAELRKAMRYLEQLRIQVITYEKGEVKPDAPALRQLADAVGVSAVALLDPTETWTLALLRATRGKIQGEVAESIAVSRATYSNVERSQATLGFEAQRQLSLCLEVTPDELAEAMAETATVGAVAARPGAGAAAG